ncbi:Filensin [Xenoophorus captivus]|uniref:Filensin n=1 Tax=Xenoophorus captivus TaxID=1517983 RepID=A0ABV0S7L2_9TELE
MLHLGNIQSPKQGYRKQLTKNQNNGRPSSFTGMPIVLKGDQALQEYHQPRRNQTNMFKTKYLHEVRKEKYERSDVFDEETEDSETPAGISAIQGWESLQELNNRFARYINRARVLEQRNAVFRKQLETLHRMEEASGLEEAFTEQIEINRQRIRELCSDHTKLERELREACRMLDEFTNK